MINRRDFVKFISSIPVFSCLGKLGFSGKCEDKFCVGCFGEVTDLRYELDYEYWDGFNYCIVGVNPNLPSNRSITLTSFGNEELEKFNTYEDIRKHLQSMKGGYVYDPNAHFGFGMNYQHTENGGFTPYPNIATIEIETASGVTFGLEGFNCHPIREFEKIVDAGDSITDIADNDFSIKGTSMKLASITYSVPENPNSTKYATDEYIGRPPGDHGVIYRGEYRENSI